MDSETLPLSEVTQTEKDKYDVTYMWNIYIFLMVKMNLFTKPK